MSILERLTAALNQSFRLVFESIYSGIKFVIRGIRRVLSAISNLVKQLHELITFIVQLFINISSILFIIFIPYAFFFDPLGWSRMAYGMLQPKTVLFIRWSLGLFFLLVAFMLLSSLWKIVRESGNLSEADKATAKPDFVRSIASLTSWVIIAAAFIYFTIFRFRMLDIGLSEADMLRWLKR